METPVFVNGIPCAGGALSVVEIGEGFAYDDSVFRRILSTPSFIRS